jgi:hypothetical protein
MAKTKSNKSNLRFWSTAPLIIILRAFGIFIPALHNQVETATTKAGGREGTTLIPEKNAAECATFAIVDFTTKKTE